LFNGPAGVACRPKYILSPPTEIIDEMVEKKNGKERRIRRIRRRRRRRKGFSSH
jgi:hypothetical protein